MNQPSLVYQLPCLWAQWRDTLRQHFSCLSLPRLKGVALFSLGLALSRRCTLSVVAEALPDFGTAEALPDFGTADTLERRLQRFLAADNVEVPACQQALMRWVSATLPLPRRMVLLVDETSLQEHLRVMCISLAYGGRALPLCWEMYEGNAQREQVPLLTKLLHRIAACLPPDTSVLVQADRGIGAVRPAARHPRLGLAVSGTCHQYGTPAGAPDPAPSAGELPNWPKWALPIRFGRWARVGRGNVYAFKKAGWLQCRALGWWGLGHKEPWLLLTNAPDVHGQALRHSHVGRNRLQRPQEQRLQLAAQPRS